MATTPGLLLLRLAPLLSSTVSVTNTMGEDVYMRPLVKPAPSLRPQANRIVCAYWKAMIPFGMTIILVFYPLSIGTALANVSFRGSQLGLRGLQAGVGLSPENSLAARLYVASAVFNAMHFAFGPYDLGVMNTMTDERIVDADKGKDNCTALGTWIKMNVVRGLVAELPGMVCALLAFMSAMTTV